FCAEHERRDVVVGGAGKVVSLVGMNLTWLTDRVMGRIMSKLQLTDREPAPRERHNLFEPRGTVLRERGHYPHYVHETSLYTQARRRPWSTLAAATLGGAAAAALWMTWTARQQHGREQPSPRERLHDLRTGGIGLVMSGEQNRARQD